MKNYFRFFIVIVGLLLLILASLEGKYSTARAQRQVSTTAPPASEEVYVPAGAFARGCTDDFNNGKCDGDVKPVTLTYVDAFYIDKTEVTNAQYAACVTAGACLPPRSNASQTRPDYFTNPAYANYPVIQVDWNRATAYCLWNGKRLPTEAEWEKAARGTDMRWYPWGNEEPTCDRLNYGVEVYDWHGYYIFVPCVGDTVPVGSYPSNASPYGALDMAGNVSEWVYDLYKKPYYPYAPYYNPRGPATTDKMEHLVRGGSWAEHKLNGTNTWVRLDEAEIYKFERIGLRCARDAEAPPPTPTPTPTPLPSGENTIGTAGGLVWMTYPDHLTVLHVPSDSIHADTIFTLTYAQNGRAGEDLQSAARFTLEADHTETLTESMQLLLGFKEIGGVQSNTLALYYLEAGTWVTHNITVTEQSAGHIVAWVNQLGTYGLLGKTNWVYLPVMLK